MTTNADITLCNRFFANKQEAYSATHIPGVSWVTKHLASVGEKGLSAVDEASIRIPADADTGGRVYVPPNVYTGDAGTWTLRPGDWIVAGTIDPSQALADVLKANPDAIQIKGVADNRDPRVSAYLQHWRVTA